MVGRRRGGGGSRDCGGSPTLSDGYGKERGLGKRGGGGGVISGTSAARGEGSYH